MDISVVNLSQSVQTLQISIEDLEVLEKNAGEQTVVSLKVELSDVAVESISVPYSFVDVEASRDSSARDYLALDGVLVFEVGEKSKIVQATIYGDDYDENRESFYIHVHSLPPMIEPLGSDLKGVVEIIDDDGLPTLKAEDSVVAEGSTSSNQSANLVVTLNKVSLNSVSFDYNLVEGAAVSSGGYKDFEAQSGRVTIPAGSLSVNIPILVNGDIFDEEDETFSVSISNFENADQGDSDLVGEIVIADDDAMPTISIADVVVNEVDSETFSNVLLTVTLNQVSGRMTEFSYSTADATATSIGSYVDFTSISGNLQIPAYQSSVQISLPIYHDVIDEFDETLAVNLGGLIDINGTGSDLVGQVSIVDNDPPPSVTISDLTVYEDSGSANISVVLSRVSGKVVSVDFSSSDLSATSGSDYTGVTNLTHVIPIYTSSNTFSLSILDDADFCETTETLQLALTGLVNTTLNVPADGLATTTILEVDYPELIVSRENGAEGGTFVYNVDLSQSCTLPVSADWQTVDGSAKSPGDYVQESGSVLFAPGLVTTTIDIVTNDDAQREMDEKFFVSFLNETHLIIGSNGIGVGLINDNEGGDIITKLSSGDGYHCALNSLGKVKCWGDKRRAPLGGISLGDGPMEMGDFLPNLDVGAGKSITQIATSNSGACAVLNDGGLKCWGSESSSNGQESTAAGLIGDKLSELGDGLPPIDLGTQDGLGITPHTAQKVCRSRDHVCTVLDNNKVKCWGGGASAVIAQGGPYYIGDSADEMGDDLPYIDLGTNYSVKDLDCDSQRACVILSDDRVKCWGSAAYNGLGYENTDALGDNPGEMGDNLPYVDLGTHDGLGVIPHTAKAILVKRSAYCAVLDDDRAKCWGNNHGLIYGNGDGVHRGDEPGEMGDNLPYLNLGTGRTIMQLSIGSAHACAILDNNTLKCWGQGSSGRLGSGSTANALDSGDSLPTVDLGTHDGLGFIPHTPVKVAVSQSSTCVVLDDGRSKCFGLNSEGQLGLGSEESIGDEPGETGDGIPYLSIGTGLLVTDFANVAAQGHVNGGYYVGTTQCAILSNGETKCWGRNNEGEAFTGSLGLGDQPGEMGVGLAEVDFGAGVLVEDISLGFRGACATLSTGQLKCWGTLPYRLGYPDWYVGRQAGDSPSEIGDNWPEVSLPVGRSVLQFESTYDSSCALLDDFAIYCWGGNYSGILGLEHGSIVGTNSADMGDNLVAVNLGRNKKALSIATSYQSICALLNDFSVKCWGRNAGGSLGLGSGTPSTVGGSPGDMGDALLPVDLGSVSKAKSVHGKTQGFCVHFQNDGVKCWGAGTYGLLGNGSNSGAGSGPNEMGDFLNFIDFGTGRTVVDFFTGSYADHSCALLDDNSVKCFGVNSSGQLGYGDTTVRGNTSSTIGDSLAAVDLGGGSLGQISLARYSSCTLFEAGDVKCWGQGLHGQLGYEDSDDRGDEPGEMGVLLPNLSVW